MDALAIILVVDVTVGVVLGLAYLCTLWEARRRVRVPILTLVPYQSTIVHPGQSSATERPSSTVVPESKAGQLGLTVVAPEPEPEEDTEPDDDCDDEDTDPDHEERSADPEWSGYPWYDSRSCWGCDKACKASKFHPYGHANIGAEIRGACASRSRARVEEPYAVDAPHERYAQVGREPSTSVAALWDATCEACGRLVRRTLAGLEPSAVPMARVADAEACPF